MTSSHGQSYGGREFHFRFGHEQITFSVRRIILITTGIFAAGELLNIALAFAGQPNTYLYEYFAFSPGNVSRGYVWTPVTYMVLHTGLLHLFVNMLMLYFFGPDVERVLGTRGFFRFYVLCGTAAVLGNYVPVYLFGAAPTVVVGASGACLAVLIAFAIVEPERQVFLFPFPFPVNARALVLIIIAFNIMTAIQPGSRTSVATHFGGLIAGYVYMKVAPKLTAWRTTQRKRRGPTDKDMDNLGKEIDNIFKFQDRKRK